MNTQLQPNQNQFPHQIMLSPTTIDDDQTTPISSFSSATLTDHVQTLERSNNQSEYLSTNEFKDKYLY